MAGVQNTVKTFQFAIEIDGIDQMLIQEVKQPEVERGSVEHGAEDYNIKTAGGKQISDAELKMVIPAPEGEDWAWNWLKKSGNSLAEDYKKDVVFKVLDPKGRAIEGYLWKGVWVKKVSTSEGKRGNQNENMMRTVTLSIDDIEKIY